MSSGRKTKVHSNFSVEIDENGKARVKKGERKNLSVSERIRQKRSKRITIKKRV